MSLNSLSFIKTSYACAITFVICFVFFRTSYVNATPIQIEIAQETSDNQLRTYTIKRDPDYTPKGVSMSAFPMWDREASCWKVKGGVEGVLLDLKVDLSQFFNETQFVSDAKKSPSGAINLEPVSAYLRSDPFKATKIISVHFEWRGGFHQKFRSADTDCAQLQSLFQHLPNVQQVSLDLGCLETVASAIKKSLKVIYQTSPQPESHFLKG